MCTNIRTRKVEPSEALIDRRRRAKPALSELILSDRMIALAEDADHSGYTIRPDGSHPCVPRGREATQEGSLSQRPTFGDGTADGGREGLTTCDPQGGGLSEKKTQSPLQFPETALGSPFRYIRRLIRGLRRNRARRARWHPDGVSSSPNNSWRSWLSTQPCPRCICMRSMLGAAGLISDAPTTGFSREDPGTARATKACALH